jgi:glycerophosphoryl diester phosphodiesterase
VKLSLFVSHFDGRHIENGKLVWSLKSDEKQLAGGSLDGINLKTGDVTKIGDAEFVVPPQGMAKALVFEVKLNETIQNDWNFWSFPKRRKLTLKNTAVTPDLFETLSKRYHGLVSTGTPEGQTAGIVIGTPLHSGTREAIAKEKRVLILGDASGEPNVRLGWWWLGDQVGTAFAKHPVYGNFPHEEYLNPLWFRIIKRGMPISREMPFENLEYLSVGEGRDNYFMYIAQTAAGANGKILMTHGLDVLTETPEGSCVLDQMLQYISSEKFQPKPAQPHIIAHCGYWKCEGSAENSLSSLQNAQKLGTYGSEFDVRVTSDDVMVVFHDKNVNGLHIESTPYSQLKGIKLENGETIPTLEQYLRQGRKEKKTKMIVEIKDHDNKANEDRATALVVDLVKKYRMEKQVEYISFSLNICRELLRLRPEAKVAYLTPMPPKKLKETLNNISGIDYHFLVLKENPQWIEEAHQLGMTVNTWTVNEDADIREMASLGVDYITTDRPVEAAQIKKKRIEQ